MQSSQADSLPLYTVVALRVAAASSIPQVQSWPLLPTPRWCCCQIPVCTGPELAMPSDPALALLSGPCVGLCPPGWCCCQVPVWHEPASHREPSTPLLPEAVCLHSSHLIVCRRTSQGLFPVALCSTRRPAEVRLLLFWLAGVDTFWPALAYRVEAGLHAFAWRD